MSLIFSTCFLATSAWGYYQDQYNPNSKTVDYQKLASYQNTKKKNTSYQQQKKKRYSHARTFGHPTQRASTGRRVFIYDPRQLSWAAYSEFGKRVRTGAGSGGRHYCPDVGRGCRTPSGVFSISSKHGQGFRSSIYPRPNGGAPMPYAMFFRKNYAIHGSYDVPGYNASHGCIRVMPGDALWLNRSFLHYGSTVIVKSY